MLSPAVSVIMTAYNTERYIAESIESLLNQTFTDFELLIMDDASEDATLKIVQRYEYDKRIKIFRNEKQQGDVLSRERLIHESRGQWIAIQDSDDLSLPRRLENQMRYVNENSEIKVLATSYERIDQYGNSSGIVHMHEVHEKLEAELLINCYLRFSSVLISSDLLKAIKTSDSCRGTQDYVIYSKILKKEGKFAALKEVLVKYRQWSSYWTGNRHRVQMNSACDISFSLVQNKITKKLSRESYRRFWFVFQSVDKKHSSVTEDVTWKDLVHLAPLWRLLLGNKDAYDVWWKRYTIFVVRLKDRRRYASIILLGIVFLYFTLNRYLNPSIKE